MSENVFLHVVGTVTCMVTVRTVVDLLGGPLVARFPSDVITDGAAHVHSDGERRCWHEDRVGFLLFDEEIGLLHHVVLGRDIAIHGFHERGCW